MHYSIRSCDIIRHMATVSNPQPAPTSVQPRLSLSWNTLLERRAWIVGLTLMAVLVAGCYAIAMNAYWVGDDFNYVRPKSWVDVRHFFDPIGRSQFRPLTWSTWALDFALFGPEPLGWHLTRLIQHIWNAIAAALLVRAITKRSDLALLAAVLFALHPAQPETVTWLGGQADASFAMAWLPALWLFVRWRQGAGKGRILWLVAGVLGFISMFGKEAAVTLPIVSLWIDVLFGREWARWPGRRDKGWWRDASIYLKLLRDHSLFIATSGLYAGLRIFLFLTGKGELMYGEAQLGFFQHSIDVVTGYILLSLGFWWLPQEVAAWSFLAKLGIIVATAAGVGLLMRWLGKVVVFAVGWYVITLMLTLQAVANRWFYLPALGVGIIIACAWTRLRDDMVRRQAGGVAVSPGRRLAMLVPMLFVAWFGLQTLVHNEQWRESGDVSRGLLEQVKKLHPNPALPATFYVANAPYHYKQVLLFNTGFDSAMSHVYNDWANVRGYSVKEDVGQVKAALADPAKIGPNPIFLRYEDGRIVDYPSLRALVDATR